MTRRITSSISTSGGGPAARQHGLIAALSRNPGRLSGGDVSNRKEVPMQADSRTFAALTGFLLAVTSAGCLGDSSPVAEMSVGEYLARLPAPGDVPGFDDEMAVEEAYRAIPHRRTKTRR